MTTGVSKHPFLGALGERARTLRARRGMSRRALAEAAGVSERHLANLEYGVGNVSVLVLLQVSQALRCSLAELIGDVTTSTPEWLLLRELLETRDESTLRQVRIAARELLADPTRSEDHRRVALLGLRGAGKSTLGNMLGADLDYPFIEIGREIERIAGCSVGEIQALYGPHAYRRHERRAVEEVIAGHREAVIAAPGGLVSDPGTYNRLLNHCTTVWLAAEPEDHMSRVVAQGDLRPMAASREAMRDLEGILQGRIPLYAQAQHKIDTSAAPLEETFAALRQVVREALSLPLTR